MPSDLFEQTLMSRPGPKRSRWTIVGSMLAHAGLVAALLVVPVLSALDNYVVLAHDLTYLSVPPRAMPAMPAAPPSQQSAVVPDVNPLAAPLEAAAHPVTDPPPVAPAGPPGDYRHQWKGGGGGPVVPGWLGGSEAIRIAQPPPPPPAPPTPRRAGGDIEIPARTYYVDPIYPEIARVTKTEGLVILEATIDESGAVRNVKVLRSNPLLDQAAVDAVSKWKYTPTKLNGVAVPVVLTVTVNFALR